MKKKLLAGLFALVASAGFAEGQDTMDALFAQIRARSQVEQEYKKIEFANPSEINNYYFNQYLDSGTFESFQGNAYRSAIDNGFFGEEFLKFKDYGYTFDEAIKLDYFGVILQDSRDRNPKNLDDIIKELGTPEAKRLIEFYNLKNLDRYSIRILEELKKNMTSYDDSKFNALVIVNNADEEKSFLNLGDNLEDLLTTYNLFIFEEEKESDIVDRIIEYKNKLNTKDLLILAGHSLPGSMAFGGYGVSGTAEEKCIDLADFDFMKAVGGAMGEYEKIFLYGCSTAKGYDNLARFFYEKTGSDIFGFLSDDNIERLVLSDEGKFAGADTIANNSLMLYSDKTINDIRNPEGDNLLRINYAARENGGELVMGGYRILNKGMLTIWDEVTGNQFSYNPDNTLSSAIIDGSRVEPEYAQSIMEETVEKIASKL